MQGAGRAVVPKELRLMLDEAHVRTLLFSNVEGELCLDSKLQWCFPTWCRRTAVAADAAE